MTKRQTTAAKATVFGVAITTLLLASHLGVGFLAAIHFLLGVLYGSLEVEKPKSAKLSLSIYKCPDGSGWGFRLETPFATRERPNLDLSGYDSEEEAKEAAKNALSDHLTSFSS